MSQTVLQILDSGFPGIATPDIRAERLLLIGLAHAHLQKFHDAELELRQASDLCRDRLRPGCTNLYGAQASLAIEQGMHARAYQLYMQNLELARSTGKEFDEASILANIAVIRLIEERFDEAIDWLNASNKIAQRLNAEDLLLNNAGNIGWAYYKLGEPERALALFGDAERRAVELGDIDDTISWLSTSGYVLQDLHEPARATEEYRQALGLASQIHSSQKVIDCLENLAHVAIDSGDLTGAESDIRKMEPLIQTSGNHLDVLDVQLAKARLAVLRHDDQQAESMFRAVEHDPDSQISMRLGAEHQLALLYEEQGRVADAQGMYATALSTFESARAQLKNEDSKLPFFANATPIYDDYIRFLIGQGKGPEALAAADQSRARTLEQGLGLTENDQPFRSALLRPAALRPEAIAARAQATLLFYWLGEKQSWLWTVTPKKTQVFPLPAKAQIARTVERYREALLGPVDPLAEGNEAGFGLYRMLIAPAQSLLPPNGKVMVLCDGALSELNFETLLVPGTHPHYWIEDADVVSAPSLLMLASGKPELKTGRLLLLGDAVSPSPDYPELPNAGMEIREIRRHFAAEDETVLEGTRANARAYLASAPERFSYIDFVAHGVASRTDPLDSAIILSRTENGDARSSSDSFKLYAREIIQHPIDARLVTISACYGNGTRSYAGEGLVGLSWAFLRAGAHNVIGALWEVSDDSTPRLMDGLYAGIEAGLPPSAALRQAKLALLHARGGFSRPFFWAPFQLYEGMGNTGYRH